MSEQRPRYALARARADVERLLAAAGVGVGSGEVRDVEGDIDADLAVPLFRAAKQAGSDPKRLAEQTAGQLALAGTPFERVVAARGYLNFRLDPATFAGAVTGDYLADPSGYGADDPGSGRTVVIDYSSPNVAKPFSVGHLRSTVIGQALHNILSRLGYTVVGDNHLGDWGTQFGKLLCAFERWGEEAKLTEDPTGHLLELYVRFHEEAKEHPELEAEARDRFRRLEAGDPAARATWQRFVDFSAAEFGRIYRLLGVRFDQQLGESFYSGRLQSVVERALAAGVARRERPLGSTRSGDEEVSTEDVVVLIPFDDIDIPLILQKSDGTSLYATREIATAEYRIERWHPERLLYVVGNEQQLYFRQFAAALVKLGHDTPIVHVNFGLIRLPGGRMSTRAGRVVFLQDVVSEAISRARQVVADRDLSDDEKDRIARIVGIGAIKYADLSQTRNKEVVFDWDKMLALDGDSAPYLQYAHTRCRSILRKAGIEKVDACAPEALAGADEFELVRRLARYPDAIRAAADTFEPHRVANYLYRLAQDFSAFYNRVPVLRAETEKLSRARLLLVDMTATVLRAGLGLLGIDVPDRM